MTKKITIELDRYKKLLQCELILLLLADIGKIERTTLWRMLFKDKTLAGYFADIPEDATGIFRLKLEQVFKEVEAEAF